MNAMQVFNNPEFGNIRGLTIEGEPWAVGKDAATALGYSNPRDALKKHVDPEDKNTVAFRDGTSGNPNVTIINESGLYSLIFSSKLPGAKRFKRWVTSEVLPTLRKTGSYTMPGAEQVTADSPAYRVITSDDYLTAARILSGCRNERLPYVLPLIRKAGIEVDISMKQARGCAKDPQTAHLLDVALSEYGLSIRELERLTGIYTSQLYRMRNGTSRYNAARATIIREVIQALCPDMDIDAVLDEVNDI